MCVNSRNEMSPLPTQAYSALKPLVQSQQPQKQEQICDRVLAPKWSSSSERKCVGIQISLWMKRQWRADHRVLTHQPTKKTNESAVLCFALLDCFRGAWTQRVSSLRFSAAVEMNHGLPALSKHTQLCYLLALLFCDSYKRNLVKCFCINGRKSFGNLHVCYIQYVSHVHELEEL